jgi:hypothetical protein
MPNATSLGEYDAPHSVGPALQYYVPQALSEMASAIPANGSISSIVLPSDGFKIMAVGAQSANAGVLSVQRYIDAAGTIPQGPAVTTSLTAATASVLNVTDGAPFQSFKITITNTGGSVATVSGFGILLQAA